MTHVRIFSAAVLCAGAISTAASAQTVIDGQGVRSGGVVIDASGVHTPGADVTAGGVRTRSTQTTVTTQRSGSRAGAPGGGLRILDNHRTATLDCAGGAAEVLGNDNTLTLSNCSRLSLPGNQNHVVVSLLAHGRVEVLGNQNTVSYSGPGGMTVSTQGAGNRLSHER